MNSLKFFTLTLFIIFFSNLKIKAQGDDCGTAEEIVTVINYCTTSAFYTNANSTVSAEAVPACWPATATSDVWLKFKAAGTDVQISVEGGGGAVGTIKQPNIALYSGSCGSTTILGCKAAGATSSFTVLYTGGLTKGNFYFIRVGTTAAKKGTFKLCISSYTPTVQPGADCDGAVKLCDKSDVKVSGLKGGGLKAEIEAGSCFDTGDPVTLEEANSSWYKWTCATAGTLTFDMIPINPQNDMDFILYELNGTSTNPCGPRKILRCNASSCGQTRIPNGIIGLNMSSADVDEPANCDAPTIIDGYLKYVDMIAGKTYLLMINNFSTAEGFTVKFGGTGTFAGPKAVITAATANEICAGGKVTYNGNDSKNYHTLNWIFTSGNPATGSGVGPYTIDYLTPGTYMTYLRAIDSTCDSGNSLDSIKVTINGPPKVDASNPTITSTDCNKPSGSITNISVSGGTPAYTYEWFKLPSISVSTDPDLTGVSAGDYYLIVTDSKSCKDSVGTFTIKPYDPPKTPGVSNNKKYCSGDALEKITATGSGGTYTWYDDADLNNQIHVGPDYLPTNTVTDTIYVTETEHGCTSDVDTVVIVINPLPGAEAGDLKHLTCRLPEVELSGSATATGIGPLSYSWAPTSGIVSGGNTLKPIVNADGNYTLTVKDDSTGCIKTDVVEVVKDPPPDASFYPSTYSGIDPLDVTFTNTSTGGANTFEWIFTKEFHLFDKDPKYTFIGANTYTVMLVSSDSSKCPDTAMVQIRVFEKFTLTIPNVFTPNGDGTNDLFTVSATGIEGLYGEIYDRWGLKMFTWELKNDGWDGRSPAGTIAPEGTYYYILKIKPQDGGEVHTEKGSLSLLR